MQIVQSVGRAAWQAIILRVTPYREDNKMRKPNHNADQVGALFFDKKLHLPGIAQGV
jgi:hypothetical protein